MLPDCWVVYGLNYVRPRLFIRCMIGKSVKASQFQDVTIGGVTKEGKDATNDLTFMILEITRQLKLNQPPIYIRCHQGMPEEILIKALECNRDHGAGMPAFMNDAPTLLKFTERGVPLVMHVNGCAAVVLFRMCPAAALTIRVLCLIKSRLLSWRCITA